MLTVLNRVNAFALAHKVLTAAVTLTTVGLVVTKFSPESLGYYYVFLSAIGLQVLFEQGMNFTAVQVASREFARFPLSGVNPALPDMTLGLVRRICIWYIRMAALYGLFLGFVGTAYFYISSDYQHRSLWLVPWILLVFAQSVWLMVLPIMLLKESQGKLEQTWVGKLISDAGAFIVFSACVYSDLGLLSMALGTVSKIVLVLGFFLAKKSDRHLIMMSFKARTSVDTYWRDKVVNFQKRLSYSWIAGYTAHHGMTLFLFSSFSAGIVGAFGASWQIIQGISAMALIPIASKVQSLAANEANGLRELNASSYRRLFPSILGLAFAGQALFLVSIWLLELSNVGLHQKFLPISQLVMLCAISIAGVVITSQAIVVRTQMIEPYLGLSLADCAAHFVAIAVAIVFNRFEFAFICLLVWQYAFALAWSLRVFSKHTQRAAR